MPGGGYRGWAALLADAFGAELTNLAMSGAIAGASADFPVVDEAPALVEPAAR